MKNKELRFGLYLCLFVSLSELVAAQSPVRHIPPTFIERGETVLLEFEMQQARDDQVTEALLFVRTTDGSSYDQQEVRFENNRALFPLLIDDPTVNSVEYYFELHTRDGRITRYPDTQGGSPPVRLDIVEPETDSAPEADFIGYTILSPEPGEVLDADDILVALTLFYNEEDVENGTFHLSMNGVDITQQAEITPYMIRFRPDSLDDGEKRLEVIFEKDDRKYLVAGWNFRVVAGRGAAWSDFGPNPQRPPSGDIELGARNQKVAGSNYDALTGRLQLSGRKGDLAYSARSYVTSQQSNRMQPQNRYEASVRYGTWLHLQAGDVYPYFSNLSVSGRRVRGFHADLAFLDERLEVQFLAGRLNRKIPALYDNIEFEEEMLNGEVVDTLYTLQYSEQGRGTYAQNLIGSRLAYGDRNRFQVAFHAMKIEDDTTSLNLIYDFNDVLGHSQNLNSSLRPADIQNLEQNPDKLLFNGANPQPSGNLVAGTELTFTLDNERIQFFSEGGFSFLNENINGGTLTQQKAEELGIVMNQDAETLFGRLSRLIIINENMSSPPFRYLENNQGELEMETFFPGSVLAGDSRVNLSYFDHQFQLRYRWIGPDYHSLANSTVRRDIAGINITDRFRVLDNRMYITLGYESLRDNLMDQLVSTLRTQTYRSSVSWYPVDPVWPRLNLSARYTNWDNNTPRFNPYVAETDPDLENSAVRNYREENGEFLPAPFPRLRGTFSVNFSGTQYFEMFDEDHQLNLSYGYAHTGDRYFTYGDHQNQNLSLRLSSRINEFSMPLRARIGYSINYSESTGGLASVRIQGVDLGAETFLMDGNLNLSMDLAFTGNYFNSLPLLVNEGEDPFITEDYFYEPGSEEERVIRKTNAWIVRAGAEYEFNNRHVIQGRVNLTNVNDPLETERELPNDHIMQVRYIFRF
ncbi:MAG: hypothetical protein WEA56_06130 [Balneolaceae bacterium]